MASGLSIKVPESRLGVATVAQPRADPGDLAATVARGGGALARGLSHAGRTLGAVADKQLAEAERDLERQRAEEKRDLERLADLQRRTTVARLSGELAQTLTQRLEESKTQAADGAPRFAQGFSTLVGEETSRVLGSIQDAETRAMATLAFQGVTNTFGQSAVEYEMGERLRYTFASLDQQANTMGVAVYSNPATFDGLLDQGMRNIAATGLSPEDAHTATVALHQTLALAEARGQVDRDPAGFLRRLRDTGETSPAGDIETVWRRLLQAESGGRQLRPDGTPVTSPKGAIGIAQVMPGTGPEAAALAGLDWDEQKYRTDAAYNEALGRAYFDKQVDTFGDLRLAAAAYNAGPGRVREHIRDGRPLPAETRAYVQKIFGGDATAPADLTQDPTLRHLTPEQISVLYRRAEGKVRDRSNDLRATVTRRVKNEIASRQMGIDVTDADAVSREEVFAAYDDPAQAWAVWTDVQGWRQVGEAVATIAMRPPSEIAALRDTFAVTPGADVEAQAGRLAAFNQAVILDAEARKDPARYVMQHSEAVQQAFDAIGTAQDPDQWEAVRRAVALSVQAQESAGFTEGQRRALPADVAKRWWDSHETAGERVAFVEMLAGELRPREFAATLEHLAGKGALPEMRQVAMLRDTPEIAKSVLRGHAALAGNAGRLAPAAGSKDWQDELQRRLGAVMLMTPGLDTETAASIRADMESAIRARYADLSAIAGDTSGVLVTDRLDQAITDVTGGVLQWSGRALLTPARGMTQGQLNEVMDTLTDADLAGAEDLAQRSITAAQFRAWATLASLGDGRYSVWYQGQALLDAEGGYFILDLRDKAAAVMTPPAKMMPLAMPPAPGDRFPTGRTL